MKKVLNSYVMSFSQRYLTGMVFLDLQLDCHLPCLYLHLYNISSIWMVCSEGKLEITTNYQSLTLMSNLFFFCLQTVPNYQRIVVFRLGRICPPKGPGIVFVLPLIDQWQKVDLRTRAFNIPPCQVNHCMWNWKITSGN